MKLDDIRVAPKLWGTIMGLLIVMLAVAAFTQNRASVAMITALEEVEANEAAITRALRWQGLTEVVIERTTAAINVPDEAAYKLLGERSAANSANITEIQQAVRESLVTDADKQAYEKVAQARATAVALLKQVPEVKATGDSAAMLKFTQEQFGPAASQLLSALNEFVKLQEKDRDEAVEVMHAARRKAAIMGLIAAAFLLAVAVSLTLLLIRSIVHPLQQTIAVAKSISEGDLTQNLHSHRHDEFGDLLKAFVQMSERLRSLVSEVRAGVDSVSTASTEIANGNQDLSARTEQTAANLEETAASMEQLTSNVTQSAETARQANQLALNATQAATRGGEVMGNVVTSMQHISDSSRRISDIIGVIDGIAFQTNILALNAAVEAARAGEQGRGFAVVASEVRSLAHRSAEAAKEIKTLIQRSVESVESGSQQVTEAGSAMQDIVMGVQRVGDLIAEISAAASEQQQGISQVNQAVGNLDQMTQQNAALVEESAAAASALSEQARKLGEVVSLFKVNGGVATPANSALSAPKLHKPAVRASSAVPAAPAVRSAAAASTPVAAKVDPVAVTAPQAKAPAKPQAASAPAPARPAAAKAAAVVDDQDWETF
ncbi:MAG: methyl-accepting chemotaxis protein [Aquabacterium sp.]|jgi:methyl-accepting chemotaxis protein|uniref:methyl-accepting chemotaxis protein n=1 Tax=Aquabacterium sp. TaxID=1872578 RepID=UPI002A35E547|nr:methyl-accepting chemotaxis protein [Aquabacterium sp.]MDX9844748.1 methyl-accepting chemotaxis protein [Aquabacterium sp.]